MNALHSVKSDKESFVAIHDRAMKAAANLKRCEVELLEAISDVERRQVYFQFELTSLFQYCVEILGLSRHAAYDFITVMRKSAEVPALHEAIQSGKTTISKARKICSVITERNSKEWIELTQHCSSRIVERCVAMANPRSAVQESMKYVSGDVLEFKFAVSEEWSELLGEIKDLMSQKSRRAVSSEEALFALMAEYKKKHDPVMKAARANEKAKSVAVAAAAPATELSSDSKTSPNRNRYIPAKVVHGVALRDHGKCTFTDRHGKRCNSGRWVQKHHVNHFAHGGDHAVENLETLCWAHHAMKHRK